MNMRPANFVTVGFRALTGKYRRWMDREEELRDLRNRCSDLQAQLDARDTAIQKYCLDNQSMLSQLSRIRRIVADLEQPEQP